MKNWRFQIAQFQNVSHVATVNQNVTNKIFSELNTIHVLNILI